MYCPKCGIENPDHGKFCRSCGTDLVLVSAALTGKPPSLPYTVDPRKRGVSWQFAITKIFTGLAFLLVSLFLGLTGKYGADSWWFWLLIPSFGALSNGIAQVFQLRKLEKHEAGFSQQPPQIPIQSSPTNNALPPGQPDYISPPKHSIYETDDLMIQPSVTEHTTRHLEIKNEANL